MKYDCFCGKGIELSKRERTLCLNESVIFCSPECLLSYLKTLQKEGGFNFEKWNVKIKKAHLTAPTEYWDFYTGRFFRSKYEAVVSKFLLQNGFKYVYEPYVLSTDKVKMYIPDFFVLGLNLFIEVKGLWKGGSKKKVKEIIKNTNGALIVLPSYLQKQLEKFVNQN